MGRHRKNILDPIGDARIRRLLQHLETANSSTPLNDAHKTGRALLAMYRNHLSREAISRAEQGDNLVMVSELLACYITLREGLPESDLMIGLADVLNPAVIENGSLRDLVLRLNLHAAKKTAGKDPFYNDLKAFVDELKVELNTKTFLQCEIDASHIDKVRSLLVKLLLVLSVRSESLLKLFREKKDLPIRTPACLPELYSAVQGVGLGPFPGLRPTKSRQVHTSEQKLWSLGHLVDRILFPFWESPCHFDALLSNPIKLEGYTLFKKGLVFNHTSA